MVRNPSRRAPGFHRVKMHDGSEIPPREDANKPILEKTKPYDPNELDPFLRPPVTVLPFESKVGPEMTHFFVNCWRLSCYHFLYNSANF